MVACYSIENMHMRRSVVLHPSWPIQRRALCHRRLQATCPASRRAQTTATKRGDPCAMTSTLLLIVKM